jgi:heme exporter protein A
MAELLLDNLALERAERLIAEGITARVQGGQALLLLGPNGSGKSTLLRALAGLLPPAAGTIAWDGVDIAKTAEAHRARLAFIGHQDAVKPGLSVAENLRFWAGLGGSAEIGAALAVFGLTSLADRPARFLSAGQKRRLALSRLALSPLALNRLALGPAELWLLDEPTNALDAASRQGFLDLLRQHLQRGGIAIIATHEDLGIAAQGLTLAPPRRVARGGAA